MPIHYRHHVQDAPVLLLLLLLLLSCGGNLRRESGCEQHWQHSMQAADALAGTLHHKHDARTIRCPSEAKDELVNECEVQHRAYNNIVTKAYEGNHVNRERAADQLRYK